MFLQSVFFLSQIISTHRLQKEKWPCLQRTDKLEALRRKNIENLLSCSKDLHVAYQKAKSNFFWRSVLLIFAPQYSTGITDLNPKEENLACLLCAASLQICTSLKEHDINLDSRKAYFHSFCRVVMSYDHCRITQMVPKEKENPPALHISPQETAVFSETRSQHQTFQLHMCRRVVEYPNYGENWKKRKKRATVNEKQKDISLKKWSKSCIHLQHHHALRIITEVCCVFECPRKRREYHNSVMSSFLLLRVKTECVPTTQRSWQQIHHKWPPNFYQLVTLPRTNFCQKETHFETDNPVGAACRFDVIFTLSCRNMKAFTTVIALLSTQLGK